MKKYYEAMKQRNKQAIEQLNRIAENLANDIWHVVDSLEEAAEQKPENSTEQELNPCPFCGGDVEISGGKTAPGGEYWIHCHCQDMSSDLPSVIKAWNTRFNSERNLLL